jgi:hypothetical protein
LFLELRYIASHGVKMAVSWKEITIALKEVWAVPTRIRYSISVLLIAACAITWWICNLFCEPQHINPLPSASETAYIEFEVKNGRWVNESNKANIKNMAVAELGMIDNPATYILALTVEFDRPIKSPSTIISSSLNFEPVLKSQTLGNNFALIAIGVGSGSGKIKLNFHGNY